MPAKPKTSDNPDTTAPAEARPEDALPENEEPQAAPVEYPNIVPTHDARFTSPASFHPNPRPAFDPSAHIIRVQGNREYLPVAARLVWFRSEHPTWSILTNPVEINFTPEGNRPPFAIFQASIMDEGGRVIATAHKMEDLKGFGDFLEKAETGAVGRALAYCGYGTQFAPELAEGERLADAPQGGDRNTNQGNARPAPSGQNSGQRSGNPQARQGNQGSGRAPEEPVDRTCSIDGCSNVLSGGQYTVSMGKFGEPLCLLHQKEVAQNGNGRSGGNGSPTAHNMDAPPASSVPERQVAKPEPQPGRAQEIPAEEKENRKAAVLEFATEADRNGFPVTFVKDGQRLFNLVAVGDLIVRATKCPKPDTFNGWLPPVALLETAKKRLPEMKPAPVAVPAAKGAPAKNSDPFADTFDDDTLTDPFA